MITFIARNEKDVDELALKEGKKIQKIYYTDKRAEGNGYYICIRERELDGDTVELVFSNFKL